MKTIEQIQNDMNVMKSQLETMQADMDALAKPQVEKVNPETGIAFYPLEYGQMYLYLSVTGSVVKLKWNNCSADYERLVSGIIHLDEESLTEKQAAMKTEQAMRVASHEAWLAHGEEIDWKSESQAKYAFSLCAFDGLEIDQYYTSEFKNTFPCYDSLEAFREKVGDEAIINMIKWMGV